MRSSHRKALRSLVPDIDSLLTGLRAVFTDNGSTGHSVTVVDRQPNSYASTFPSEVVTCRLDDAREMKLLCKYGNSPRLGNDQDRGQTAYEAFVYRNILQPLQVSTPAFYGSYTDPTTNRTWLVIEYLTDGLRLNYLDYPKTEAGLSMAARWIGRFHALNEKRLIRDPIPLLHRCDGEYYLRRVRRTLLFAGDLCREFSWLAPLCEGVEQSVALLRSLPRTVIHGEYTVHNILVHYGEICPVDWESVATGLGEIDLASLTDNWPSEVARQCELEYQRARWPEGPPDNFRPTLDMARVYWNFRWLGDRPEWTLSSSNRWRFERLHLDGQRLGLI